MAKDFLKEDPIKDLNAQLNGIIDGANALKRIVNKFG